MISLALWEGKLIGGSYDEAAVYQNIGILGLNKGRRRFCTAAAISEFTLITAATCIFCYEHLINFGGIRVRHSNKFLNIVHLQSHPDYNETKQYEFDVGLVTVSNFHDFKQFSGFHDKIVTAYMIL